MIPDKDGIEWKHIVQSHENRLIDVAVAEKHHQFQNSFEIQVEQYKKMREEKRPVDVGHLV
jgi:hypothetical protein